MLDAERLLLACIDLCSGLAKLHHRFLVDGPSLVEQVFGFEGASTPRLLSREEVAAYAAAGG